jgi:hypothetical protein
MGRTHSTHGGESNAYMILMGNLEGNRPVGRTRHR